MKLGTASLTAVIVTLNTVSAWAQDADSMNDAGIEAFAAGQFEKAANNFAAAYAVEPDPIFRKSEAVAWFKAGDCEAAVKAANAFLLEWKGESGETDEAASVVANCKIEFADEAMKSKSFDLAERLLFEAEDAARDSYTTDRVSQARVELARLRREEIEARDDKQVTPPPEVVQPVTPPGPPVGGVVSLATGGTLVAAAALWHVITLTRTVPRLEAEAAGGDVQRHAQLSQRVDIARVLVPTLYGLGIATAGLGVWLFIDRKEHRSSGTATGPAAVGFSWSGRF